MSNKNTLQWVVRRHMLILDGATETVADRIVEEEQLEAFRAERMAAAAQRPTQMTTEPVQQSSGRRGPTPPSLSAQQQAEVVRRYRARESISGLAKSFSVSRPTIDVVLVRAGLKTAGSKKK